MTLIFLRRLASTFSLPARLTTKPVRALFIGRARFLVSAGVLLIVGVTHGLFGMGLLQITLFAKRDAGEGCRRGADALVKAGSASVPADVDPAAGASSIGGGGAGLGSGCGPGGVSGGRWKFSCPCFMRLQTCQPPPKFRRDTAAKPSPTAPMIRVIARTGRSEPCARL